MPRNIMFVVFDQLRADCVSGALSAHVNLPNIRAFRKDAVSFDQHMSVVNPCGPSRTSILTGQYAMNHRSVRNGTPLRHDTPNLATELRTAGYTPLLFGYTDTSQDPRIHAPQDPALRSYEHPMTGFREALEMRFEESWPWRAHLKSKGYQFDTLEDLYRPASKPDRAPAPSDPAIYAAQDSDTAFLTDQVIAQLSAQDGATDGWCAHVTYIRPHPPLIAPAPYNEMYDPATLPHPRRAGSRTLDAAIHPFCAPAQSVLSMKGTVAPGVALHDAKETEQQLRAIYFGLATEVDHHFGRVIDYLKRSGQYEDTLIVLTADHGEMLGDHYLWGKQTYHDAAYHVPLSIRLPGNAAQAGSVHNVPTESIDIMPTILEFAGRRSPNCVDGRSLLPLLRGKTPADWRSFTFAELDFGDPVTPTIWQQNFNSSSSDSNLATLRGERFKLVVFANGLPPLLFDREGEGELKNLAQDPAYADTLTELMHDMLRHRMRNMDHLLALDAITPDGPRRAQRF